MLSNTRISIPLSNDEFVALTRLAVREMRDPRDQARYLLRSVLFAPAGDDGPGSVTKNNRQDAKFSQDQSIKAVGEINP